METARPVSTARRPAVGGFTLVEVLVALVVLSIGAAGIIQLLGQSQQQNGRRRTAEAARRIAATELQAALAAGAWNVPALGATARTDAEGSPDPNGTFQVSVQRQVVCDAAAALPNDAGTPPPPCAGASAQVTVRVDHLDGAAWTTLASRTGAGDAAAPATGSWTFAGVP